MENVLNFPQATIVNKNVPKNAFYKRADSAHTSWMKQILTDEFENITWLYKLHPSTLNVEDGHRVHEIDVFVCTMKSDHYSINPFCSLDDLLPRHTMFIIRYGESTDLLMQHKEMTLVGGEQKWTRGKSELQRNVDLGHIHFSIEGQNMDKIYGNLLGQVSGLETGSEEDYKAAVELRKKIENTRKQILSLQKQIRSEKQFNLQMEMNAEARQLKKLLGEYQQQLTEIIEKQI